jgi:hypothetical protein
MGIFNITAIQDNKPTVSDAAIKHTSVTQTPDTTGSNVPNNKSIEKDQPTTSPKTIVLDGPLSKIYSDALNLTYSKESMMTMSLPDGGEDDGYAVSDADIDVSNKGLYVYSMDGEEMDNGDVVEVSDKLRIALDSKKYSKVILACESKTWNKNTLLLASLADSMGVQVFMKRKRFLEDGLR